MSKPEFKLFPCVFCTIGFNGYVATRKLISATADAFNGNDNKQLSVKQSEANESAVNESRPTG